MLNINERKQIILNQLPMIKFKSNKNANEATFERNEAIAAKSSFNFDGNPFYKLSAFRWEFGKF